MSLGETKVLKYIKKKKKSIAFPYLFLFCLSLVFNIEPLKWHPEWPCWHNLDHSLWTHIPGAQPCHYQPFWLHRYCVNWTRSASSLSPDFHSPWGKERFQWMIHHVWGPSFSMLFSLILFAIHKNSIRGSIYITNLQTSFAVQSWDCSSEKLTCPLPIIHGHMQIRVILLTIFLWI